MHINLRVTFLLTVPSQPHLTPSPELSLLLMVCVCMFWSFFCSLFSKVYNISSRCFYAVHVGPLYYLDLLQCKIYCDAHSCFFPNQSLLAGHVGFFQFVTITNNSARNIRVLACLCVDVGVSLEQTIPSGNAGPMLNFSRCYRITIQNGCTISHAHHQCLRLLGCLYPH